MLNPQINLNKLMLIFFCIYILIGNTTRFSAQINFYEIFLIFIFSLHIIRKNIHIKSFLVILTLILLILISLTIGIIKTPDNIEGVFYSFRLMLMLVATFSIGYTLKDYEKIVNFKYIVNTYINVYIILSIISILILIAFPESTELWGFLSSIGIYFNGDPHINRIVSTYFDPNFFGNILLFPFLLCLINFQIDSNKTNLIKLSLLLFVLVFTFSRSAIASILVLFGFYYLYELYNVIKKRKLSKNFFYLSLSILIVSPIILSSSYINQRIIERFSSTTSTDDSTLARLDSFRVGNEIFMNNPLLGSGYGFTQQEQVLLRGNIGSGIDSSIQNILISFGIIGSLIILFILLFYIFEILKKYKNKIDYEKKIAYFFIIYFLWSIFFLSNFNQLIFYPFWLLPTLGFGIFLVIRK
ncbi:O-antigen ligase family protein [Acinetobacter sp. ACZLY 512]|uniref:O-antigen ligase family protein n=1 Tax=Acinetobacter sp. ACZLY 512 TaxID=2911206 RepID=UPI002026FB36|nr:O-antigen ligase family protein [Acinetobacter sp. ACZLY 512]MCL9676793.1 O-antigen ligase family protein [Acinetobacter sp. ACZLY 512]